MRSPACLIVCLAVAATVLNAQTLAPHPAAPVPVSASAMEPRTARAFQAAAQKGPLAMHSFLTDFPKGADLHIHLSGAVYSETFIRDAAEDGICVNPARFRSSRGLELRSRLSIATSCPFDPHCVVSQAEDRALQH